MRRPGRLLLTRYSVRHVSFGLGLRQIIDGMFFVEAVVSYDFWQQKLKPLAERTGLTILAVIVTRMCEIYLGAPMHSWASDADINACEKLFILLDNTVISGRR